MTNQKTSIFQKIYLILAVLATLIKRKKKIISISLVILVMLFGVYLVLKNIVVKPNIKEGIIGTYTEIDLPEQVTKLLTKSLITIDPVGLPRGELIKDWQINKEATVYTLKLKDNLYWVDGTLVKAADIDIDLPGAKTKAIDDKTLEFKLVDSYSPFLSLLNKPVYKRGTHIGIGPYKITQIKKDQIFVSRILLESAKSDLPQIVIRFYPNENIAKDALKLGEIESLIGINNLSDLAGQKTFKTWSKTNYQQLVTIFYNTKDPILSDENFRLALSFAAPSIKGETEAITSLSPTSWAFNPQVKDYLDNPEQAKSYLGKVKNGKDSVISLTATSFLSDVGQRVIEAWKKQGIKTVLRVESGIPQNFQALLITQNIPADPDQYSLWHSTQTGTNISKFDSKRVDKDLEDGRKITDIEVRKQRYQDFQKVLLDHSPATFLYFSKLNAVYRAKSEVEFKKVIDLQI